MKGEGIRKVELSGLDCLKGKDPLRFGKEINAIRWCRPMTLSFPPNKVDDELRDPWSSNGNEAIWIFDSFFSNREGDLDDEHKRKVVTTCG